MSDEHTGQMLSGEVTCSCGWKSGHYAFAGDAADDFDKHLAEVDAA
jgi:hypothetical protein